jgi:hypothetical protein
MRKISISLAALLVATFPTVAHADVTTWHAAAYGEHVLDLKVCSPRASLTVIGDGDTDLDFLVTDPGGNVIASESSSQDRLNVTFRTGIYPSENICRTFKLHITNYGHVYNEFAVYIHDA